MGGSDQGGLGDMTGVREVGGAGGRAVRDTPGGTQLETYLRVGDAFTSMCRAETMLAYTLGSCGAVTLVGRRAGGHTRRSSITRVHKLQARTPNVSQGSRKDMSRADADGSGGVRFKRDL